MHRMALAYQEEWQIAAIVSTMKSCCHISYNRLESLSMVSQDYGKGGGGVLEINHGQKELRNI